MASLVKRPRTFQIATGNDADADRHGVVTPDAGLMNPNHYLAVAIDYLYRHRTEWPPDAGVGKTLVSSSMIDRVVGRHGPQAGRGAGRLQVVRARADRRLDRFRRRGVRRRLVPAQARHRLDHRQGRHPAGPARLGNPGGHRQVAVAAVRRADGPVRRSGLRHGSTRRPPRRRRPSWASSLPQT